MNRKQYFMEYYIRNRAKKLEQSRITQSNSYLSIIKPRRREYLMQHQEEISLKRKEYYKEYFEKNKEKIRFSRREYFRLNREKRKIYNRMYYDKIIFEVLSHYSKSNPPKCVCCEESNIKFLTLDHINGRNSSEPKRTGYTLYMRLKKDGYPEGLQTLCFNCNCGRAKNGGVCPHKEENKKREAI